MALDKKQLFCTTCKAEVKEGEDYVFKLFNDDLYYCKKCVLPFKTGMALGEIQINTKFIHFMTSVEEPYTKKTLTKYLNYFSPLTKIPDFLENEILNQQNITLEDEGEDIQTPQELYDELSRTIIGQDIAKKSVSIAMINHMRSLEETPDFESDITHSDKHHVLLLGKSGSGKTLIASSLAKYFNLPFATGDATNYSPTGFHGQDADSVVQDLLLETNMNFEMASRGVVFIDEIDKICSKNTGKHEPFMGSVATQSTFLKLVEGKTVKIPSQTMGEAPGMSFNLETNKMLFFFGGAFNGLADILAKKMGLTESTLGFRQQSDGAKNKEIDEALRSYEIFTMATREQMVDSLIEFGMLSELVGRIPTIVALKPLSKEELLQVLTSSEASPMLKQQAIFAKSGFDLEFSEDFLTEIVSLAYNSAVGTRALDSYIKQAVSAASFDCLNLHDNPNKKGKILITKDCVTKPEAYQKSLFTTIAPSISTCNFA